MEEKYLIQELSKRNELAFRNLVDLYQQKVYNTCLGLMQNTEDAEDITQEVFVSIYNSIHQFKSDSKLYTWIYRIAVTKSLEYIRAKSRKKRFAFFKTFTFQVNDEEVVSYEPGHFHHPGVQLENKELSATLFQALNKIPENQKTAFILHKLEDLSYTEIAEIMNVSLASVESLMFRAKQNLRKVLSYYYEENFK